MFKESETIEFKKSTAELKGAVISIVAMLNKHGRGEVYFGIDDDGKILGQTVGRTTIKDVTQAVVDNTEPKFYPKVEARMNELIGEFTILTSEAHKLEKKIQEDWGKIL